MGKHNIPCVCVYLLHCQEILSSQIHPAVFLRFSQHFAQPKSVMFLGYSTESAESLIGTRTAAVAPVHTSVIKISMK